MPLSRIALVLFCGASVFACDPAANPPPAAPSTADLAAAGVPACSLEGAMLGLVGNARLPVNCGRAPADTVCDEACRDLVRGCVLESVRARQPFTVAWTNPMNAGVATRRAVVGRPREPAEGATSTGLEITWLDLTWIDGYDPEAGTMTKKRVRITRRHCEEIEDVAEACDPRLAVASAACASPSLATDAGMRCEGPDEMVCSD